MAETSNEVKKQQVKTLTPEEPKEHKSLATSLQETRMELNKVHWPKPEELKKYTAVVIATVLFFSVVIYIIDSALGYAISLLVK